MVDLSPDDERFLRSTGVTTRRVVERKRAIELEARRDSKPRLPIKTMIVVAILAVLAIIGVQAAFSAAKPYVEFANSKEWLSVSGQLDNADSTTKDYVDGINEVNDAWNMRPVAYLTVIIMAIMIEAILVVQWLIRMNSWEKREREREQKRKKRSDSKRRGHYSRAGDRTISDANTKDR